MGLGVASAMLAFIVATFAAALPDLDLRMRHRMLLHNLFIPIPLAVLTYSVIATYSVFIGLTVSTAFLVGYLSHVFLDTLTVQGVALFYPLTRRRYRLARLRSNDPRANNAILLISILMVITAYAIIWF